MTLALLDGSTAGGAWIGKANVGLNLFIAKSSAVSVARGVILEGTHRKVRYTISIYDVQLATIRSPLRGLIFGLFLERLIVPRNSLSDSAWNEALGRGLGTHPRLVDTTSDEMLKYPMNSRASRSRTVLGQLSSNGIAADSQPYMRSRQHSSSV